MILLGTGMAGKSWGEIGEEDEPEIVFLIHTQLFVQGFPIPGQFIAFDSIAECMNRMAVIAFTSGVRLPGCILGARDWMGRVSPTLRRVSPTTPLPDRKPKGQQA